MNEKLLLQIHSLKDQLLKVMDENSTLKDVLDKSSAENDSLKSENVDHLLKIRSLEQLMEEKKPDSFSVDSF